jgi:myo-inositol-hexaphosphate 3-phosphohydrolase
MVMVDGRARVIVGVSDGNDSRQARLALFELDTASATLKPLGKFASGIGEASGFCMYLSKRELYGFVTDKLGAIAQLWIQPVTMGVAVQPVRLMKLPTEASGCVADDRTGQLYVTEQAVVVWRFAAEPSASGVAVRVTVSSPGKAGGGRP